MECDQQDKLDRLLEDVKEVRDDVKYRVLPQLSSLKVKSGLWGMIGGCIPLMGAILTYFLGKK